MSETGPELSFDRATYASPAAAGVAATPCSGCKKPLGGEYWKWQRLIVCGDCREGLVAKLVGRDENGVHRAESLTGNIVVELVRAQLDLVRSFR